MRLLAEPGCVAVQTTDSRVCVTHRSDAACLPAELQGTEHAVENLTSIQLQDCSHWAPEDKCVQLPPHEPALGLRCCY